MPLEEFKPHTEYFALGRGTGDLILIGPNDLLEDDVIDVTNTGLPALNIDNYQKFFVDHDTPQVWVGHRTPIAGTLGSGTSALLTDPPDYLGDFPSRPTQRPATVAEYYYDTTLEYFEGGATYLGNLIWTHRDIVYLQGANARWLGQQVNANAVANLIQNFDSNLRYLYFNTTVDNVHLFNNADYVAPINPSNQYTAEPISAPTGIRFHHGRNGRHRT